MQASLEPASHYFYSDRLKLQFWDWGTNGKPALLLVHGGLDHARSWDGPRAHSATIIMSTRSISAVTATARGLQERSTA